MNRMPDQAREEDRHRTNLEALHDALERESTEDIRRLVQELHPAEVALLLESLPLKDRDRVWDQLDPEQHTEVLSEAEDSVRAARLLQMPPEALAAAARALEVDDAADLLQDLPEDVMEDVLLQMDAQNRQRLEQVLAYPEDTAGGLMNVDTITVRGDVTLGVVVRYLRRQQDVPKRLQSVMVVDRENRYEGSLPLSTLLIKPAGMKVVQVMDRDLEGIPASLPDHEVAKIFEQRDLIVAPVVDPQRRLLGHIFIDDVVDVIRQEGEHSLMSFAGLEEGEDIFAPVIPSARRRTVWLGINLATAFLASWVIGLFQAAIHQVVALAVLMPIVASMGGIAGTQTLTVMIRGMALGQLSGRSTRWVITKELLVGFLNGCVWAVVVALVAVAWFQNWTIGMIIAAALVVNLLVAGLAGVSIPLALRRMAIDPALAGGVILTTVTDVVGFMSFLGLATLVFLR